MAFNFFATDASLETALYAPRLLQLALYGNPVLGPTGSDTSGAYSEALMHMAEDIEIERFPKRHLKILVVIPHKIGSKQSSRKIYESVKLAKVRQILGCDFLVDS